MPQRTFLFLFLLTLAVVMNNAGCRYQEERVSDDPSLSLEFNLDSVLFDTVFTDLRTITRVFRVYNRSANAVSIARVQLGGGTTSPFDIWVNGQAGGTDKRVEEVLLRGGDSLLVLVEAEVDGRNQNNPFLILDSIAFLTNGNLQHVILQAYGRDAIYHRNETISQDTTWTNEKPHIILDQLTIDSAGILRLRPGTQLFMQNYYVPATGYRGANLFVEGILIATGTCESKVRIEGLRQEERFDYVPGQWGALVVLPGGQAQLEHTVLREGLRGIQVGFPEVNGSLDVDTAVLIANAIEVYAMEETGLLAFDGRVNVYNSVFADCAQRNLNIQKGGKYSFLHNTFAYSDNLSFSRRPAGVYISDGWFRTQTEVVSAPLTLFFESNIVDGPNESELFLFQADPSLFAANIAHNLLKYNPSDPNNPNLDSTNRLLPYTYRNLGPGGNSTYTLSRMPFVAKRDYNFAVDDSLPISLSSSGQALDTVLLPPNVNVGNWFYFNWIRPGTPGLDPAVEQQKQRIYNEFLGRDLACGVRNRNQLPVQDTTYPDAGALELRIAP